MIVIIMMLIVMKLMMITIMVVTTTATTASKDIFRFITVEAECRWRVLHACTGGENFFFFIHNRSF